MDESGGNLVFNPAEPIFEWGKLHQSWPAPQTHGRLYRCLQPDRTPIRMEEAGRLSETSQNTVRELMQLDTSPYSLVPIPWFLVPISLPPSPGPRHVVRQRHAHKHQEHEDPRHRRQLGQLGAVLHMHEKQHHEHRLDDRNAQRDNRVENSHFNIRSRHRGPGENQQRNADGHIDPGADDVQLMFIVFFLFAHASVLH